MNFILAAVAITLAGFAYLILFVGRRTKDMPHGQKAVNLS